MPVETYVNIFLNALVGFGTVSACIISLVLANKDPRKKSVCIRDLWYQRFPGSFCFLVRNKRAFQIEIKRIALTVPHFPPYVLTEEHGKYYHLDPYSEGKIELISPIYAQLQALDPAVFKDAMLTVVTNLGGFEISLRRKKMQRLLQKVLHDLRTEAATSPEEGTMSDEEEVLYYKRKTEYQTLEAFDPPHQQAVTF